MHETWHSYAPGVRPVSIGLYMSRRISLFPTLLLICTHLCSSMLLYAPLCSSVICCHLLTTYTRQIDETGFTESYRISGQSTPRH
ncbi:hypothetical protein HDV63DRAFT_360668 [Trichoderma sp. SZMC 28014]